MPVFALAVCTARCFAVEIVWRVVPPQAGCTHTETLLTTSETTVKMLGHWHRALLSSMLLNQPAGNGRYTAKELSDESVL